MWQNKGMVMGLTFEVHNEWVKASTKKLQLSQRQDQLFHLMIYLPVELIPSPAIS
jgi:hypothetical protein